MLAPFVFALVSLVLPGNSLLRPDTCVLIPEQRITFYGWPDNDPAGNEVAYDCGGRNGEAGGTGTFADPLTVAVVAGSFAPCTILYSPYLKKFLRVEDICAICNTTSWVDVWVGGDDDDNDDEVLACENSLTGHDDFMHTLVRIPPGTLPVDGKYAFFSLVRIIIKCQISSYTAL